MMGSGYYGSSSSSNLSPLAPPFTVDRSNNNKPGLNSNPVSNFNDPSYAVSITSALPYSQSTGGQEFFGGSPSDRIDYGCITPDPVVNPPTTRNWCGLSSDALGQITPARAHWSSVNPDSVFYNLSEAKPFHPPYACSVKKDDVPLVSFSETGCDVFSASGVVHGDETDYTRNLSGLVYNPNPNPDPKQEGISSRLSEKPVEKMENDHSIFLEEANPAASFAYNDYLNQGSYCTESLSKGKDDPSMLCYADIIRRANNYGKSDGTSYFASNHCRLDSNEFSKEESHFKAFPLFSESGPLLIQSPENPLRNSQKLTPPYEKRHHHMFEDRTLKSTTKSSPVVIKSPAAAFRSLEIGNATSSPVVIKSPAAAFKSLEIGNATGALNVSDVVVGSSHKSLKEKEELHLPQLSFQMGRTDAASFSIKDTKSSSASDQLNFEFKARASVLKVPDINIPDTANSFDHHNPAEDSPCWKGTPSLPFGSPETQSSTKKLPKDTNLQGTNYSHNNHSSHEKTSSSFIPFHTDKGAVEDSLKVRDGGDDAIKTSKGCGYDTSSQTPKPNLSKPEDAVLMLAEMYGEAAHKKVNASILVKALYNLSDLLLRDCSNEVLKEHDHVALDHVIHNLGVCMSRQVQVAAASTNILKLPPSNISQEPQVMNETSGRVQDGEQHAHQQKMKPDLYGENVKNLLEHASLRDLDLPKSDNLVQAIKKVLDENLEHAVELPSETALLYKNLWLEAEAELCSLSFRARFEHLKRETQKEKPHKSTATEDASAIKKTVRSYNCNVSTFSKDDTNEVSNAQHIDDASNVHQEQNPVKEGHVAGVKATGSGVAMQHQLYPRKNDDEDGVEPWVIARLNILKQRGELNAIDFEEEKACGEERESRFQDQAAEGSGSDWEHILKDEFGWRLS